MTTPNEQLNKGLLHLREDMIKTVEGRLAMMQLDQKSTASVLWSAALEASLRHGTEARLFDQIKTVIADLMIKAEAEMHQAGYPSKH